MSHFETSLRISGTNIFAGQMPFQTHSQKCQITEETIPYESILLSSVIV